MIKTDILVTAFLIVFKFTIAPTISWWLVFSPIIIGFIYGFIKGFDDGLQNKHKK